MWGAASNCREQQVIGGAASKGMDQRVIVGSSKLL